MSQQTDFTVKKSRWPVWLIVLAAILLFVAERYVSEGVVYKVVLALAGLAGVGSLVTSLLAIGRARKLGWSGEVRCLTYGLYWSAGFVVSVLLYFAYNQVMGESVTPSTLLQKALLASWLVLMTISLFSGVGIELAMRDSGYGPNADARRIVRSGGGWLIVGLTLAGLIAINFAGAQKDKVADWTYLKTTEPGEATKNMLAASQKEVQAVLFYPLDNEVLPHVQTFFENMQRASGKLKIEVRDKDLHPTLAEELKVSRNGQVILVLGEQRERIDIGLEISQARNKLKTLDAEFQKAFLKLTSEQKTVYFTSGHGEMTWLSGGDDALRSLRIVEKLLRQQNYRVRQLTMSKGAAMEIPKDASVVVLAGPTSPLLQAEVDVLANYVKGGGKLMVFLDVDRDKREGLPGLQSGPGAPLLEFLKLAGVMFKEVPVANEANYVSATKTKADRWFLFSNNFTSHESVKSLAKHEENIPLLLYHTAYLVVKEKTGPYRAYATVRSLRDSFADENRNFEFDKDTEAKKTLDIAAALEYDDGAGKTDQLAVGRMIVAADSHIISDAVAGAGSPANLVFLIDGLRWLAGESEISGTTNTEEDVKIRHSRKENLIWFHSSVYGVPLFILLVGFIATRRKKVR